jgi:hypothetical protein
MYSSECEDKGIVFNEFRCSAPNKIQNELFTSQVILEANGLYRDENYYAFVFANAPSVI